MTADSPDNVIALAPYRMARLARRQPSRPFLMWHPNVSFFAWPHGTAATPAINPLHAARAGDLI